MTKPLEFNVQFGDLSGDFGFLNGYFDPIKEAATLGMRDLADLAKQRGRENIAAAGFGKRWQNTFRSEAYPDRKFSASPAAFIYHRIPYAGVFEEGATISGKPLLWVPLSTTPKLGRNKGRNPRTFRAQIGPLFSMRNARQPLLGAKVAVTKAAARRGPPYKITRSALKRGASGNGIIRTVPVFVGVNTVKIRKRFDLQKTISQAATHLPALYLKNLKA